MAIEIERKFRLKNDSWREEISDSTLLRQGYLANTAHSSVRVRIAGPKGWLSVKAMTTNLARAEFEYPIPVAEAEQMLRDLCEGPRIEKWRHRVVHGSSECRSEWEIDEFLGENAGLVIAELELTAEDAPYERPGWLGPEVTSEERYYNFRLARYPYRLWPENLLASE
jgi:adenylate cyclase